MYLKCYLILIFFWSNEVFSQKTILWSVKDTSGNRVSYLLGTLHQMGNSFVDSFPQIVNKLKSAELAIFESVIDESNTVKLINNRKDNKETINFIDSRKCLALKKLAFDWSVDIKKLTISEIGIKLEQSIVLTLCDNFKKGDTFKHFDNYLIYKSNQYGIPVLGLESDTEQLNAINQKQNLNNKKGKAQIVSMSKILHDQDRTKFNCEFSDKYKRFELDYRFDAPGNDEVLLKARNEKWLPIILGMIQNKNCFITVGLLHLYYNSGLINQLRCKGLIIEPVFLN